MVSLSLVLHAAVLLILLAAGMGGLIGSPPVGQTLPLAHDKTHDANSDGPAPPSTTIDQACDALARGDIVLGRIQESLGMMAREAHLTLNRTDELDARLLAQEQLMVGASNGTVVQLGLAAAKDIAGQLAKIRGRLERVAADQNRSAEALLRHRRMVARLRRAPCDTSSPVLLELASAYAFGSGPPLPMGTSPPVASLHPSSSRPSTAICSAADDELGILRDDDLSCMDSYRNALAADEFYGGGSISRRRQVAEAVLSPHLIGGMEQIGIPHGVHARNEGGGGLAGESREAMESAASVIARIRREKRLRVDARQKLARVFRKGLANHRPASRSATQETTWQGLVAKSPCHGSLAGGWELHIRGANFNVSAAYRVRLEDGHGHHVDAQPTRPTSADTLTAIAPRWTSTTSRGTPLWPWGRQRMRSLVTISVFHGTSKGIAIEAAPEVPFTGALGNANRRVRLRPCASVVAPQQACAGGGTLLEFQGQGFNAKSAYRAVFVSAANERFGVTSQPALATNATLVRIRAPKWACAAGASMVRLYQGRTEVSPLPDGIPFRFLPCWKTAISIGSSSHGEVSEGDSIAISGTGFDRRLGAVYRCKFEAAMTGGRDRPSSRVVSTLSEPARAILCDVIHCQVPALQSGMNYTISLFQGRIKVGHIGAQSGSAAVSVRVVPPRPFKQRSCAEGLWAFRAARRTASRAIAFAGAAAVVGGPAGCVGQSCAQAWQHALDVGTNAITKVVGRGVIGIRACSLASTCAATAVSAALISCNTTDGTSCAGPAPTGAGGPVFASQLAAARTLAMCDNATAATWAPDPRDFCWKGRQWQAQLSSQFDDARARVAKAEIDRDSLDESTVQHQFTIANNTVAALKSKEGVAADALEGAKRLVASCEGRGSNPNLALIKMTDHPGCQTYATVCEAAMREAADVAGNAMAAAMGSQAHIVHAQRRAAAAVQGCCFAACAADGPGSVASATYVGVQGATALLRNATVPPRSSTTAGMYAELRPLPRDLIKRGEELASATQASTWWPDSVSCALKQDGVIDAELLRSVTANKQTTIQGDNVNAVLEQAKRSMHTVNISLIGFHRRLVLLENLIHSETRYRREAKRAEENTTHAISDVAAVRVAQQRLQSLVQKLKVAEAAEAFRMDNVNKSMPPETCDGPCRRRLREDIKAALEQLGTLNRRRQTMIGGSGGPHRQGNSSVGAAGTVDGEGLQGGSLPGFPTHRCNIIQTKSGTIRATGMPTDKPGYLIAEDAAGPCYYTGGADFNPVGPPPPVPRERAGLPRQ